MRNRLLALRFICIVLCLLPVMGNCAAHAADSYEYKQREKVCFFPSFTNENEKTEILSVSTEDGYFVCMTTDAAQADAFINAQRTLLRFLEGSGMTVRKLNYVALNFDDNFSESAKDNAYIALSSTETWRQVLATLHALWGDYTDYGYVYAMANAIAAQLGWETEALETEDQALMAAFFREHPTALSLLYPVFTPLYATEETVRYSRALSLDLFQQIDWRDALKQPVETQLSAFEGLLQAYAGKIGASFSRQILGYAYRGPYLPLCIQTTYASHIVDHGYRDYFSDLFDDCFSDYAAIYQTAEILDKEIVEAVKRFGLEERAGNVSINWLSEYSAMTKYAVRRVTLCNVLMREAYITSSIAYLHAYYRHIAHLINPDSAQSNAWQTLAFCEIGRSHSRYALNDTEKPFTQDAECAELFYSFTGHAYQAGVEDHFEAYDVWCYAYNDFGIEYRSDLTSINSFTYYLIKHFGEDAIVQLMLYPDTVMDVTGKTWETLENEWKQAVMDKYAGKEIPSWVSED